MKRQILIIVSMLIATAVAMAQDDLISKCEDISGVTTVSISSPMLKKAGPRIDNKDISAIADKMDHIDIITTSSRRAAQEIQKIVNASAEIVGSQKLIHVNDKGEKVTIKYRQDGTKTSYYLFSHSNNSYTLLIFEGPMTVDEILSVVR